MSITPTSTRQEKLARLLLLGLFVGLITAIALLRGGLNMPRPERIIELRARMPENGGWLPEALTVETGEPILVRLTSDDVVHGFAVGQNEMDPVDISPGRFYEVRLVFNQPGKYTFYCTRWCGANHWRMRGVIGVTGEGEPRRSAGQPPYVVLGVDIDAPHPAEVVPAQKPKANQALELLADLPRSYLSPTYYQAHSPAETWLELRGEPALMDASDEELWDLVAWIWRANTTPEQLQSGEQLYAENCAACHGETGGGDGLFANAPAPGAEGHSGELTGHGILPPTSFQDVRALLGAKPAVLHGKIVRGGMGTGMPYWGPVFTDEEIWALVAYLYAFQIEE
jgi:mono/diheme cytochrome c family protein